MSRVSLLVIRLALTLCIVTSLASPAHGQESSAQISAEPSQPQNFGPLTFRYRCVGQVWAPEWFHYEGTLEFLIDGIAVDTQSFYTSGSWSYGITNYVPAQPYDQRIGCRLTTSAGGESHDEAVLPGSGPNAGTLKISAFIDEHWVNHPYDPDRLFGGDDRGFAPYDGSSRAYTIYDILNPAVNAENEVGPPWHEAGLSQEYDDETSLAWQPFGPITWEAKNDWNWGSPMKTRWQWAEIVSMHCTAIERIGADATTVTNRVRCVGAVRDPLVDGSPTLDWDLTFTMQWGERRIRVSAEGCRDGYPSYESYINGQSVFQFNDDGNILSLFDPCEWAVNASAEIY